MAKNGNVHPTRIFSDPNELLLAWEGYLSNLLIEADKWFKIQYVGKDGYRVTDSFKLPYTLDGFYVYCYKNYGSIEQYFKNSGSLYDNFIPICLYIKQQIRENQITGGLLGVYNPSITQRLNNLVEKTEDVTQQQPKKIIIKVKRATDEDN